MTLRYVPQLLLALQGVLELIKGLFELGLDLVEVVHLVLSGLNITSSHVRKHLIQLHNWVVTIRLLSYSII